MQARDICPTLTALALLLAAVPSRADTIHVPADQPTIGAAVAVAQDGDVVLVADGVYTGAGNRDVDFGGRLITVRSENGPDACIIDCEHLGRAFILQSGETTDAVIEGFTIRFGSAPTGNGGAIDCTLESGPTIRECVFIGNEAFALGGAIACRGMSLAVIERCTFIGNAAIGYPDGAQGGAISCFILSDATITDCLFLGNVSDWGGGIDCSVSFPEVTNCLFVANTARIGGGGVFCGASDPLLTNCTFTRNTALAGGALVLAGAVLESHPVVTNCVMWGDSPNEIEVGIGEPIVSYSLVQGSWPGTGNLSDDPVFVDPFNDDFRLAAESPAVDAGNNLAVPFGILTDLDGNPRFIDHPGKPDTGHGSPPLVDMGAYEFQTDAVAVPPTAFAIPIGRLLSGGVEDLRFSDDAYLLVEQRPAFTPQLPVIRIDTEGTAPGERVSNLAIIIEAAATAQPVRPLQRVSAFDFAASAFEVVDERSATLGDSAFEVPLNDPGRFIEPGTGALRTRLEWFDPGNVFFPAWHARVDQAIWTVEP